MNTKTMEGLIGASATINMTDVPMRVYHEAKRTGDTGAMERALGYAGEFAGKAEEYKAKAREGTEEEARAAREKEKAEREKAIAKRKGEQEKSVEKYTENGEGAETAAKTGWQEQAAAVEISPEGRELLKSRLDMDGLPF